MGKKEMALLVSNSG